MKLFLRVSWIPVFLFALFMTPIAHAATAPSLGAADPYGVLTYLYGRFGLPGPVITGDFGYTILTGTSPMPVVSGATHVADGTYTQAETDGHTAWVTLEDSSINPCTYTFTGSSIDLATKDVGSGVGIYPPGVYCAGMATTIVNIGAAGIKLNGSGTYIFRFDGGVLFTSPFSVVTMQNGASSCGVFWLPDGPAILSSFGHDSTFVGTVFSHDGYNVNDGVTWYGRALTLGGGTVNMASDEIVTAPTGCTPPPPPPPPATGTLHVIKQFYNDYGGTAVASDANVHVKNGAGDIVGSPHAGSLAPGTLYTVNADTYIVSEDTFLGYTPTIGGDCDATGHVTIGSGDSKTCIIANDQNPPPTPSSATLHVIKHVVNNNGGSSAASSFTLHVKGSGGMGVSDVSGSPAAGAESPGVSYTLLPGAFVVSEDTFSGYTSTFSGDCDATGHVTLASSDHKTCTITNTDIAPSGQKLPSIPATLHVMKIVTNDNGGKAIVSDAVIHVMSGAGDVSGSPHAGASTPGTAYTLDPGIYTVSENFFPGYTVKIGGDCNDSGNVTLAAGDSKTCTITNDDIAAPVVPPPPTIITPVTVTPATCDICSRLTYDLYIINPDKSERHTGTAWVRVTDRGNGIKRYSFEDATLDPHNPLFDYNDSVIDVDYTDCKNTKFMFVSSDASWKHQVRIKVSIDGAAQSDTLVVDDSKAVVGTMKAMNVTTGVNAKTACTTPPSTTSSGLKGKILLQVQSHGEAWYIHPISGSRYYMKDGVTAYGMMRKFGVGITDKNLLLIPSVASVAELKASTSICPTNSAAKNQAGKIMLQVQQHGEAWYVDAGKCRRIYLKDGAAAYSVMRFLGLGITNADLEKMKIGS
ncbi:MAG: ice-binding family protein [Candidatus Uhrbacteria bacterium]|nr:ice-binding family protein [Candidatus Uhrbacteria bacterium]